MAENEDREHRAEEYVKLCFEVYKHLTTLSTAGALVVLAVYREVSVEKWQVTLTLALFGITILTCLFSMLIATGYFSSLASPPSERVLTRLLTAASASFMMAVAGFMFLPIDIPLPPWLIPSALLVIVLLLDLVVVIPLYRSLRKR